MKVAARSWSLLAATVAGSAAEETGKAALYATVIAVAGGAASQQASNLAYRTISAVNGATWHAPFRVRYCCAAQPFDIVAGNVADSKRDKHDSRLLMTAMRRVVVELPTFNLSTAHTTS